MTEGGQFSPVPLQGYDNEQRRPLRVEAVEPMLVTASRQHAMTVDTGLSKIATKNSPSFLFSDSPMLPLSNSICATFYHNKTVRE
jgi:hypothetical protein